MRDKETFVQIMFQMKYHPSFSDIFIMNIGILFFSAHKKDTVRSAVS